MFEEGFAVRNRHDPSQVGLTTGETRVSGGRVYNRVKLSNGEACGSAWKRDPVSGVIGVE